MSHTAYIAIGTNLGDRQQNYRNALEKLNQLEGTRITRWSSLYESEPHGEAPTWFVNGVVEVSTEMESAELLKALLSIEDALGRKRTKGRKNVSRTIDLDILLFDSEVVDSKTLRLPHPEMASRRFVLLPLSELAPRLVHPVLGKTVTSLLVATEDTKKVRLFLAQR